jgi:tape measure domain-containing protein
VEGGDQSLMATVDDKVVAMSFESSKFESGVNSAINALNKLKSALNFPHAGEGLDAVSASASKVDLNPIARAIDAIKSKFSALSVVALTVLTNIVNKAVNAGLQFAKSLTVDPIIAGFHNYETQINAVQTILANTGLTGKKGLAQVNAALADLNTYANKTVYNFSEMARNIGTFTAAGVGLKTSEESIKGIANLAALSGSSADQASSAMYQLSQAIAAGRVKLQDWNSVVNAGIGGKVFQSALYNTGVAMGTIKNAKLGETFEQWTKAGNTFRGSLQSGWLTSKVLTTTLKGFTGDMTTAQLKAQGYTDAQIKNIEKMGKVAYGAATNIKTLSQLSQALKEEVATAWAAIFKTIFGNLGQATTLFSAIHNVAENALTKPIYDLNKLLEAWAKLGGRTLLIDGLKQAWKDLGAVMAPIKAAFREIFPPETAQKLVDMTKAFDNFMKSLMPSTATIANLKRTFAGLFAILDIGKQLISGVLTVFGELFATVGKGGGGFLNLTGNIGDFLVSVDKALKSGNKLHDFFVTLGSVLAKPIQFLEQMATAIGNLFSGFGSKTSGGFSIVIGGMAGALTPLQKVLAGAKFAWDNFWNGIGNVTTKLTPAFKAIADEFKNLGDQISSALQNINWAGLLDVIRTGLLGGMYLVFKKFFGGGFKGLLGGGVLESVSSSFEALTGTLKSMQQTIKAATLLEIAAAVGILTASIVAMSLIDEKKLDKALSGVMIAMGELLGAMALLNKISLTGGFLKMPLIAGSMILLATAVDILTLAVGKLAGMSWEQLAKGLGGVGALLAGLALVAGPLSKSTTGLITAGVGITAIAVALNILALAVKQFGGMSLDQLGKGMTAVAVSLGGIALASKLFPSGMIQIGAGLVVVATGLKILAGAVASFGGLSWAAIAKGMASIAAALVIIAGAMEIMPSNMVVTATGLLLISVALKGVASSIESLGGQSVGTLAKGIVSLAVALGVLAIGMDAMSGSLAGAAALAVAAASLTLLAPALTSLGRQSWGDIIKGLVSLAAAFAVLGVAGLALAPVSPALLALGAALLLIGGGLALAGAGIALVGVGLSAIAVSGPAALAILVKAFTDFMAQLPLFAKSVVDALVSMVTEIANAAPQFVASLGKILVALSQAVVAAAPQLAKAFDALIQAALQVIINNFPNLVNAGVQMLLALLRGIRNNIAQVTSMVSQIIITFLNSISNHLGEIVAAGVNVLIHLVQGIANSLNRVVNVAGNSVSSFVIGIGNNLGKIVSAGGTAIAKFVTGISDGAGKVISAGADAIAHILTGIGNNVGKIVNAGVNAIGKFISAIGSGANQLVNKGADSVISFMNGVANTLKTKEPQIMQAGWNIGWSMVQGMINGMGSLAGAVVSKAENIIGGIPGAVKKLLHIGSPSKVFYDIGVDTIQGMINGISDQQDNVTSAVTDMTNAMIDSLSVIPDTLSSVADMNPVITPVLDLTQVQAGATQMNALINTAPVVGSTSYGQASTISSSQAPPGATGDTTGQSGTTITYQQNNYSPESLSEIEIYRQTKNQLSQLRTALAIG